MNEAAHIHVVRHGATALNNQTDLSEDRIRGWRDVPLAPQGKEEAIQAADKLRSAGIQVIVTSDLARARETAMIISQHLGGVPVQANPKLRPWNLGNFTGMSTKEALPLMARFIMQMPDQPVPGGESFHQFVQRANEGLAEVITLAGGRPVVIVTHHRDERLWKAEQAVGWAPGQLDLNVFQEAGDPPGGVFEMNVPPNVLPQIRGGLSPPPGAPAGSPPPPGPVGAPPSPGLPVAAGPPGGVPGASPGMLAQPPQPDPMMGVLMKLQQIQKAIDLLRSDIPRGYRIDIEVDTMVAGDHEQERADATELLKAITDFMQGAGMIVPHMPQFAPLAAKMLQFGVRKYRTGRDLESAIDEFADKIAKMPPQAFAPPQPPGKQQPQTDPNKVAAEKIRGQTEIAKAQLDAKSSQDNDQRQGQLQAMEFQMKMKEFQMRMAEMEREEQFKLAEHSRRMQDHQAAAATAQIKGMMNGPSLPAGPPASQ